MKSTLEHQPAENGSVTAEYAVLLPTAVLVLAVSVNVAAVGIHQVRMEEAAAAAARQLARGEPVSTVTATVHTMAGPDTSVATSATGEWASVELHKQPPGVPGWWNWWDLTATAHAPNQWSTPPGTTP